MTNKTISSPLVSAFNNISNIGQSAKMASRLQSDFMSMINFIETQNAQLDKIELPDKKKIRAVSNINIASTFGSPGGLLGSLASGALDIAGFLGNFFPGRGKIGKPLPFRLPGTKTGPKIQSPKVTPRGSKLRFGGIKGLGVLNALFTGLDFYQGLQEGESVGKAATGAGASLAGSIVGGVLGSALGPLGTFAGASLGGFVGGWLGDRAYETLTGEGKVRAVSRKLEQRRKSQFEQQKGLIGGKDSFSEVINKFDNAVSKFEKGVAQGMFGNVVQEVEHPTGYDEELTPEDQPTLSDKPEGPVSYGSGNAEFGETGNVRNSRGWVHGHFQGSSSASVVRDTTMVVKALLQQGSPVYLNPGVDLSPKKKYTDDEIRKYVERARQAHSHSGTGKSIDVFVRKGTKVPVSLVDVKPTGSDYGGYGRGGIAGYIQGTDTWIGHLTPNSKSGLAQKKGEIKGTEAPNIDSTMQNKSRDQQKVEGKKITESQIKPPNQKTDNQMDASLQMKSSPQMISAPQMKQVDSTQNIQYYPSYNQPQSSITIMAPIPTGESSKNLPIIPSGPMSSGPSGASLPNKNYSLEGEIANSFAKIALLTNLSGS